MGARLPRDRDHLVEPLFAGLRRDDAAAPPEPEGARSGRARLFWGLLTVGVLGAGYLFWG